MPGAAEAEIGAPARKAFQYRPLLHMAPIVKRPYQGYRIINRGP